VKKVLNCWILNGGIGRGMCAVGGCFMDLIEYGVGGMLMRWIG
jgi:hypothetical protein